MTPKTQNCVVFHITLDKRLQTSTFGFAGHVTTLLYLRCESEKNFTCLQKLKLGASTLPSHLPLRDATACFLVQGLSELSQ